MPEFVEPFPPDEYNQALAARVQPPDWVNPKPAAEYNLVVIGAGTAGLVAAMGAAGLGAKVALVERHRFGGDCLNVGCVPSKALIGSSRAVAAVRNAGEFGVRVPHGVKVDFPAVMQRMRRLRAQISHNDSVARFRDAGVDVFLGQGAFENDRSLRVNGASLNFQRAVITTGTRPAAIPIPGLETVGYLTNETLFDLTELPRRLAVVGAGPVGCEMAQAFARFGSEVWQFERHSRPLSREDEDAAGIVRRALERDGVRFVTETKLREVRPSPGGKRILYERENEQHELEVDEMLLGVGRSPNVEGLGLDAAGVEYDDKQGVKVDDFLRTTNPRIYAAGDICSRHKFTHTADFQARLVIQNALFQGRGRASALIIPWCTYTDPEIAHVGLYAHEAEARGEQVHTLVQNLADVDRALLDGETEGFVKIHLKKGSDRILGATVVAAHAGDLISEISVAMRGGLGLKSIGKTIHPYPTQAESIRKLGDAYNRTRLTPLVRWAFGKWFSWKR